MSDVKTKITAKNGIVTVKRTQDVEPILNANRAEMNEAPTWRPYASRRGRNLRKVAEIPNIVVEKWLKEGINIFSPDPEMQKKFRQKLNDYNYRYLRTYPGRMRVRDSQMSGGYGTYAKAHAISFEAMRAERLWTLVVTHKRSLRRGAIEYGIRPGVARRIIIDEAKKRGINAKNITAIRASVS